jgi:hypothetical protein
VLLSYTSGSAHKLQRIWIRQGEGDDWLMRPSDPSGAPVNLTSRPKAMKFSPYNLTAREFNDGGSDLYYDVRPGGAPSTAVFTEYPSQAGAHFQWAVTYNGEPAVLAHYPVYGLSLWPTLSEAGSNFWSDLAADYESCPEGYRRPTDGITDDAAMSDNTQINNSEMFQSLFNNPQHGTNTHQNDNAVRGFYADGYFDRLLQVDPPATQYMIPGTAVSHGYITRGRHDSSVAYVGLLFYNPVTYSSLFFPATGYRNNGNEAVGPGNYNYYRSSSSAGNNAWGLWFDKDSYRRNTAAFNGGGSIRCVAEPPPATGGAGTIPPTTGWIAPENILAVNNLGQLNLDGQKYVNKPGTGITSNYIVYIKYGSLMAISADLKPAWVPPGFSGTVETGYAGKWLSVPYVASGQLPVTPVPSTGLGDLCMLATKNGGEIGQWRMPEWLERFTAGSPQTNYTVDGINYGDGYLSGAPENQFYPFAKVLNSDPYSNICYSASQWSDNAGYYRTNTPVIAYPGLHHGYWFRQSQTAFTANAEPNDGMMLRCVPDVPDAPQP